MINVYAERGKVVVVCDPELYLTPTEAFHFASDLMEHAKKANKQRQENGPQALGKDQSHRG